MPIYYLDDKTKGNDMNKATRINEFTPDTVNACNGFLWLQVQLTPNRDHTDYEALPKVVSYDNKRFYKMSYNSDYHLASYKEAKNRPYHLRYCD